jgi:hypothetical protein
MLRYPEKVLLKITLKNVIVPSLSSTAFIAMYDVEWRAFLPELTGILARESPGQKHIGFVPPYSLC